MNQNSTLSEQEEPVELVFTATRDEIKKKGTWTQTVSDESLEVIEDEED